MVKCARDTSGAIRETGCPGGRGHCQPRQGVLISALGVPGQQVAYNTSSNACISPLLPLLLGKMRTGRCNAFLPKVTGHVHQRQVSEVVS